MTQSTSSGESRRNFLKIGAGVVAGAAVASVVEIPYYSSVIGGNNSSSSSTVSSLSDQLNSTQSQLTDTQSQLVATQSQLSDTQSSLTAAQNTIGSLSSQVSSQSAALNTANAQVSSLGSQLTSTQQALTSANGQISTLQSQASSASAQASSLSTQLDTVTGFLTLNTNEQSLLEAIAEALIPSDGNGPGAKEAGVIYFIDRQLATDYGKNAHMYMQGPFIPPNLTQSITVDGITYPGGSNDVTVVSGMQYQYHLNFRDFFRYGLQAFETYCNSAYSSNFENLSPANQVQALTDLYNNKPTSFNAITPSDFFYQVFVLVWSGYFMDPLYGGNQAMAAWSFSAFNGLNQGDFYGEGHTTQELMLATTPTRLRPASLAQYQKGSP